MHRHRCVNCSLTKLIEICRHPAAARYSAPASPSIVLNRSGRPTYKLRSMQSPTGQSRFYAPLYSSCPTVTVRLCLAPEAFELQASNVAKTHIRRRSSRYEYECAVARLEPVFLEGPEGHTTGSKARLELWPMLPMPACNEGSFRSSRALSRTYLRCGK